MNELMHNGRTYIEVPEDTDFYNDEWIDEVKDAYRKGYIKGYHNKYDEVNKARKEAKKEYLNRLSNMDICSLWPFNLICDLEEDTMLPSDEDKDSKVYSTELILRELPIALTARELSCVELYYKNNFTLEEIGKEHNIGKERVRQIIAKAKRKLKHPTRSKAMRAVSLADYESLQHEYEVLRGKFENLQHKAKVSDSEEVKEVYDGFLDNSIAVLDLSVRSYNCLTRAGYKTIKDLSEMSYHDLYIVRNLGFRSAKEVIDALKEHGIVLHEDKYGVPYAFTSHGIV